MIDKCSRYIELMYQVRAREQQNVEDYFSRLKHNFEVLGRDVIYGAVENLYWPVNPEEINLARSKGFLVTDYMGDACILVRTLPIKVILLAEDGGEELLNTIISCQGDIFSVARIVTDYLTEVGPQ